MADEKQPRDTRGRWLYQDKRDRIYLRVTPSEHEVIRLLARRSQQTISAYVLDCIRRNGYCR